MLTHQKTIFNKSFLFLKIFSPSFRHFSNISFREFPQVQVTKWSEIQHRWEIDSFCELPQVQVTVSSPYFVISSPFSNFSDSSFREFPQVQVSALIVQKFRSSARVVQALTQVIWKAAPFVLVGLNPAVDAPNVVKVFSF